MRRLFLIVVLGLWSAVGFSQESRKSGPAVTVPQLISCIKSADVNCVAAALASGTDPDSADSDGVEALSIAAEGERSQIVSLLLNAGAKVDGTREAAGTPLCRAALFGQLYNVKALLAFGANVNVICDSDHGDSPLMDALRGAWLQNLPEAFQNEIIGSSTSDDDDDEETKMKRDKMNALLATPREKFLAVARLLMDHGADVNVVASCDVGENALMYAAMGANVEMTKAIVAKSPGKELATATLAFLNETEREYLKFAALDLPALSKEQRGMLRWTTDTADARAEIRDLLKAAGAEEIARDADDEPQSAADAQSEVAQQAFSDSIEKDDIDDLERLLDAYRGHPLSAKLFAEALRIAVIHNHQPMVRLLLARDANPNGAAWPPLFHAAGQSDVEMVKILVEAGADVNATDENCETPLDMAERWGASREDENVVAEYLRARGAVSKKSGK